MEFQTKTQIEYGQSNINLSIDMSLQESFKSAWTDSISCFITEYGLNPGNFRMWLNGKKHSNKSETAVKKWLSKRVELEAYENLVDIVIKKMSGSQFQKDLLEISPEVEGIIFVDGDQALTFLFNLEWLFPYIEKRSFSPIVFFCTINSVTNFPRITMEKIYNMNKICKCIYVNRCQFSYKNTSDIALTLQIGMASTHFQIYTNPTAPLFFLVTNDLFGESLAREINGSDKKLLIIDSKNDKDILCFLVFQLPKIFGPEKVSKIIDVFSPAAKDVGDFFYNNPAPTYPLAPWITRNSYWKAAGIYQFYDEIQIGKLDPEKISSYTELSQNKFLINLKKDLYQGKWKDLDKIPLSCIDFFPDAKNDFSKLDFPFFFKKNLKGILTLGAVEEFLICETIYTEKIIIQHLQKMKVSKLSIISHRKIGDLDENELKFIWKCFWKKKVKEFCDEYDLKVSSFSGWIGGRRESDFIYANSVKKWLAENLNKLCC